MHLIKFLFAITLLIFSSYLWAKPADTLLTNATIYQHPQASTIAITDGVISHIGTAHNTKSFQSSQTEIIDLESAFILPGFVDNHNHVFEAMGVIGGDCELSDEASLTELKAELHYCYQQNKRHKDWIIGYGFSIDQVMDYEQQTPLEIIDAIFPHRPVIFMEQTSHAMWVNSKALALAGITSKTSDPQGGVILKDEQSGELTGILLDNAGDIVMELAWNATSDKFNKSYDGLIAGLEETAKFGITTIGDGRLYWKRGWFEVWQQVAKDKKLTTRVSLRPWVYPNDNVQSQLKKLKQLKASNKSELLYLDQVKMYSDGIFTNGTARTFAPYLDTYLPKQPNGIHYIPPKAMQQWLLSLDKIGYGAHIHTIGDSAVNDALNAITFTQKHDSDREYTLTHVELVDSKDLPRFKQLGVTADFQVGSSYIAANDHQWAKPFLGKKRAHRLVSVKSLYQTGANISLSSDWNVNPVNPLLGIANSLIMKQGLPNIDAAIQAYTLNPAKSLGLDHDIGSIEVGKKADFVVLDRDIRQLKPWQIKKANVLMTILEGKIVFDVNE